MGVLERILVWLFGFRDYVVPKETLYITGIVLTILLAGTILSPYDRFILVLAFTLPILFIPLLATPLIHKSNITVYRKTRPGLAGSTVEVELLVHNNSSIPLILAIEEYSKTLDLSVKCIISVGAKGTGKIRYNARGRVGKHLLSSKTTVYDPLNIIGITKREVVKGDESIRFKPRVIDLKGVPTGYFSQIVPGGGFRSNIKGLGYDFYGLRKYVHGDPIKLVDWKTTARQRELFVKEYILETGTRVLLALLLTDKSFAGKPAFFENVSEALASIVNKLLASGSSAGLVVSAPSYNGLVEVSQGKNVLGKVIEVLSNVPWLSNGVLDLDVFIMNILKASRHPKNTKLIIVFQLDGNVEKNLYEKLVRLRETGFNSITLVLAGEPSYPELYRLLEKKGVEVIKLEDTSREFLAKKILEVIG